MTATAPAKLLATGGIRTVEKHVSKPVVYQFPVSFNSGKATLAMQLSQKADEAEIRYVLHMRDNYTPEYVRLNPDTMAVPTMEIDDKVCTDSMDLCKYLMDNYPGPGDQEVVASGRQAEMMDWVNFAAAWDEYMFTYGHMDPGSADMANAIRLENLRIYLDQVLTEKPADVDFLVNCYIKKITGITTMRRAQETGADKEKALEENKVILHRVLARGNDLVGKHPGGFLFGDKLTTADVYFLPIFRIFQLSVPAFRRSGRSTPTCRAIGKEPRHTRMLKKA